PSVILDGEALVVLSNSVLLIAVVCRDADLDGDLLLIAESGGLRAAWRAAAVAPPARPLHPTVVMLADAAKPPDVVYDEGLPAISVLLQPISAAPAVAGSVAPPKPK